MTVASTAIAHGSSRAPRGVDPRSRIGDGPRASSPLLDHRHTHDACHFKVPSCGLPTSGIAVAPRLVGPNVSANMPMARQTFC